MGNPFSSPTPPPTPPMITRSEFNRALTDNGYDAPSKRIYKLFVDNTDDFSHGELAMFLAQVIHESGGFEFTEEQGDVDGDYDRGPGGVSYHGRGYIQLTWRSNYEAASKALGMGNKLVRNPDLVAEDEELAMQVSVWYWEEFVRPKLRGRRKNHFGVTTKAINGALECSSGDCSRAKKRYRVYKKVAKAMDVDDVAEEYGCYN